jgi:NAD(P)-dependent dehydrogenase (short-subunit alcohol dehydrogenase family)
VSNDNPTKRPCAVVTGSSSGIGQCIAEHLLQSGWQVIGLDMAPPTTLHPNLRTVQVDLADHAAIMLISTDLTNISAFVHAAGVLRVGHLGELDPMNGELMWQIHTQAAISLANVLIPRMRKQKYGRAVFIGSRVAQGMPGRSQYAATKAAVIALARSWASEVASAGVTVNVVSPAATQTTMLSDPARATSAPRLPPLGRLIQPQEIAELVAFLLSPSAAAITGQDIAICGGASLPQ